jgi:hypothetical protein
MVPASTPAAAPLLESVRVRSAAVATISDSTAPATARTTVSVS